MKIRFSLLSIISLLVIISITSNSCTVTKRVHRKGWHISWNKNYRSTNETAAEKEIRGNSDQASKNEERIANKEEITSKKPEAVESNTSERSEEKTIQSTPQDSPNEVVIDPEPSSKSEEVSPNEALPPEEEVHIPIGGPFVFFGVFTALSFLLLLGPVLPFILGSVLIAVVAGIILFRLVGKKNGKTRVDFVRPGAFYNSILFITLFAVTLALMIGYGALSTTFGVVFAVLLLLLIALLCFLVYATKDQQYSKMKNEKIKKEEEKKEEKEKNATPQDKKKQRIAGLVIAGIVLALFLVIGLASN